MNKPELIDALALRTGERKPVIANFIDAFEETVQEEVAAGGSVLLVGFLKIDSVTRPARTYRNPQTGAALELPAKRVPKITAGRVFKDSLL